MTYRLILTSPLGLTFEMLTEEQQAAVRSVLGQYVLPMPSTIPHGGKVVFDGLAADNFNPVAIGELGLPFEILGMWDNDDQEIIPLDVEEFNKYLPDGVEGIPHSWAGWSKLFGE